MSHCVYDATGRKRNVDLPVHRWQVDSAVLRLHGRRCTALEFHPVKACLTFSDCFDSAAHM